MDHVYESNIATTPPTFRGVAGYPKDGAIGAQGTVPGAWWFHMITEELRAVLVAGGVTPNGASAAQLSGAIKNLVGTAFTDEAHSIASNGYFTIPGINVLVQWGTVAGVTAFADATITFPTAFGAAPYHLGGICFKSDLNTHSGSPGVKAIGTTTATVFWDGSGTADIKWFAIGVAP